MRLGRRRFLVLGAMAPAAALAACTDTSSDDSKSDQDGEVPAPDLDALEFAAGLEVAAAAVYQDTLDALTAGKVGALPAAGTELLQSAMAQHKQCLTAINDLIEANGRTAVADPNVEFKASVTPGLTEAKGWPDIAALARTIETALAATHLETIHSTLRAGVSIRLAGGIQATGQKRVAILNFLLGEYPVPDTFQKTDAAVRA